jgi:hypothetical protein
MEQLLNEMTRRSAVFDIVFWEGAPKSSSESLFLTMLHLFPDTRHLTLKGGTDFVASSRSLARALLFGHLVKYSSEMGLEIYAFSSLTDPAWHAYQQRTKVDFFRYGIPLFGSSDGTCSQCSLCSTMAERLKIRIMT